LNTKHLESDRAWRTRPYFGFPEKYRRLNFLLFFRLAIIRRDGIRLVAQQARNLHQIYPIAGLGIPVRPSQMEGGLHDKGIESWPSKNS
jgi:hypothetical protein